MCRVGALRGDVGAPASCTRDSTANRSSMLQDIDSGRRTEIGSVNGAVVREAEALGFPALLNRTLTLLVKVKAKV